MKKNQCVNLCILCIFLFSSCNNRDYKIINYSLSGYLDNKTVRYYMCPDLVGNKGYLGLHDLFLNELNFLIYNKCNDQDKLFFVKFCIGVFSDLSSFKNFVNNHTPDQDGISTYKNIFSDNSIAKVNCSIICDKFINKLTVINEIISKTMFRTESGNSLLLSSDTVDFIDKINQIKSALSSREFIRNNYFYPNNSSDVYGVWMMDLAESHEPRRSAQ